MHVGSALIKKARSWPKCERRRQRSTGGVLSEKRCRQMLDGRSDPGKSACRLEESASERERGRLRADCTTHPEAWMGVKVLSFLTVE